MVRVYHDIKRVWLFHGTHIKCVGQDCHEISVKELSHGMEKKKVLGNYHEKRERDKISWYRF